MRIRTFCKLIDSEHLKDYTMNNTTVVIDGQNFFYSLYQKSGLQFIFGCESDQYAAYVRRHLAMFKNANITCYFVWKGGHEDLEKRLKKTKLNGCNFVIGQEYDHIVKPIFTREVSLEVLDEMNFNYTICKYEAKKEIIALAQKLNCPIVSYDIEYVFSGHPYIPSSSLNFDEQSNRLTCGIFSLDNFLQRYRLSTEKFATFAAVTDENNFPENHFLLFLKTLRIPLGHYKRNIGILLWLGRTSRDVAVKQILQRASSEDRCTFLEVERKVYDLIQRKEIPGIPTQYLLNGNRIDITEKDPSWFEKGVASKHVPISLINSQSVNLIYSYAIADNDSEDAQMLSLDIIKYTANLLTNFKIQDLNFYTRDKTTIVIPLTDYIQKADHIGPNCPFEDGWDQLPKGMFEHFLREALDKSIPTELEKLPEDCRMLMIALIYLSKRKPLDVTAEVLSILLSYVALSVLPDNNNNGNAVNNLTQEHLNPDLIVNKDKEVAKSNVQKYFERVGNYEAKIIFNPKWLHPLVEFQHCLLILNNLNILCGRSYKSTVFNKTINATFVYKVLYTIKNEYGGDGKRFVEQLFNAAPTVLTYLRDLESFVEMNK